MNQEEVRAILSISLLAAYADSDKHTRERDEIRRIAEGLSNDSHAIHLPSLYQDVLLKRTSIAQAAARLPNEESRQLAYEMAVCVCDADGSTSEKERAFLNELQEALQLKRDFAAATLAQTESLTNAPLPEAAHPPGLNTAATAAAATAAITPPPTSSDWTATHPARRPSNLSDDEIKSRILRASITNGAIELLPESLATMAIIPLQMRLVYQIGQSYGFELDKGHIRDFLATIGVGMTSQYLEQAGRKLLGGLLGKAGKGILGGLGKQAISSGMSFASTYALGHVANQYYAGGRQLSTQMLKEAYNHVLSDGRQLQNQYLPQMREQASQLNTAKIMAMVRGQSAQPS